MSKLHLIIGTAICATFSLLVANVVVEAFSQAVTNNNTKRDAIGNYINYTNSSVTDIKNNLMKDYPTNTSR